MELLLATCMKDADFDAIRHDIKINGDLQPSMGLPIGYSEMDMGELMGVWQSTDVTVDFNNPAQLLTFKYSNKIEETIDFTSSSKKKCSKSRKSGDSTSITLPAEHLQGSINIDLFENMPESIKLKGTNLLLQTYIKAYGYDDYQNRMERYGIKVSFSDIHMDIQGYGGSATITPDIVNDTITFDQLLAGDTIVIANNKDLSSYLNMRPRRITYSLNLNVTYNVSAIEAMGIDALQFVHDSILVDSIYTITDIDANFPLQLDITNFSYSMDMDLNLGSVDSAIAQNKIIGSGSFGDNSYMALRFQNTIPLNFSMRDTLIDEHGNIVRDKNGKPAHLYQPTSATALGADILGSDVKDTTVAGVTYKISNGIAKETLLKVNIGEDNLDAILKTRKLRLGIYINTSGYASSPNTPEFVTIRKNDKLKSNLYVVLNPAEGSK